MPRAPAPLPSWVALLRGINVGGRNKVPMARLRQLFEDLGHTDVSTYIASGNVLFRSKSSESALTKSLERALIDEFKLPIRVILRSAPEMSRIAARPLARGIDPARFHVFFCAAQPKCTLETDRSPQDSFTISGREIYLHCPNGAADTKFTLDYIERRTATTATARNWRTVTALAERVAVATTTCKT